MFDKILNMSLTTKTINTVEIKTLNDFIRTGFVNVGVLQKANAHLQFMFM